MKPCSPVSHLKILLLIESALIMRAKHSLSLYVEVCGLQSVDVRRTVIRTSALSLTLFAIDASFYTMLLVQNEISLFGCCIQEESHNIIWYILVIQETTINTINTTTAVCTNIRKYKQKL